jgi:hypothetical protein
MQLPEKYKENFDVSSEGPWSGVTNLVNLLATNSGQRSSKRRNSPHIFQVVAPTKACPYYWHYLHWQRQFKIFRQLDIEVKDPVPLTWW